MCIWPVFYLKRGFINMYDVVIIGAGVIGSAVARELSRYELNICVVEKEEDVCCGTSKANSGIVHAGFDARPGSLKARLNVLGSRKMAGLARELDIPYRQNGSVVLSFDEEKLGELERLKNNGETNGVSGLEIITGVRMKEIEPNISGRVKGLLYVPSGAIVCPFKLTIALAENANVNGVEFKFDTGVSGIEKLASGYLLTTGCGVIKTRAVVNAAGVYADTFHNMVSDDKIDIVARKGEYCLIDKKAGNFVRRTVFQLPTQLGKGVLVTPTVHGNLMIGPTAYDTPDKEGTQTTAAGMQEVMEKAGLSADDLPVGMVITSFAGLRAHAVEDDFIIGEVKGAEGFFDAAGIESPGLSSAPAIGEMVADMMVKKYRPVKKETFITGRKDVSGITGKSIDEVNQLIRKHPEYGNVICRCESITEGEILDAIHRPLGARSLDGVKRRTRAGMGRCQSGFCAPRVIEILARELKLDPLEITKSGRESRMLSGHDKDQL